MLVDESVVIIMVENRDRVFAEMEGYICKECKERIKGKGNTLVITFNRILKTQEPTCFSFVNFLRNLRRSKNISLK